MPARAQGVLVAAADTAVTAEAAVMVEAAGAVIQVVVTRPAEAGQAHLNRF